MILGVDYGKKRVGLALGSHGVASPYRILRNSDLDTLVSEIASICKKEKVAAIVVGKPLARDRLSRQVISEIKTFSEKIRGELGLEVFLVDEAYSSKEACELMVGMGVGRQMRRDGLDQYAAVILLNRYFEERNDGSYERRK